MVEYKNLFLQTQRLTILLVEDYEPLRDEISEFLEMFFTRVIVCQNGEEALDEYIKYREKYHSDIDLVLSDIQMPLMNGVELTEHLRQLNPKQQIIILSGSKESDYLVKLINLKVSYFIAKPLKHEELLETLYHVSSEVLKSREKRKLSLIVLGEGYTWDKEELCLKNEKEETIPLTRHELFLMEFMVAKNRQLCTQEEIIELFDRHNIEIGENSIRNLVFKLRKKLPEGMISTLYGMGYTLTYNG